MRALDICTSQPWAITQEVLTTILEIAARENLDPQAVAAQLGRPLDNTRTVSVRDGVAVIPIAGPIFRYANLFTEISGGTSVQVLGQDFNRALSDPAVRAILLDIDSPGGGISGINEFADMVFAARGVKPITAYVGDLGASAAYWIASAADEIVVHATAAVGSIGVVAAVKDPTAKSAKEITFVSSQSPNKRADPTTESGRSQIQALVDDLATEFVGAVARNRGVATDKVLADFGQGSLLIGRKAVTAGLADRLGSFESVLAKLAAPPVLRPAARVAASVQESGMSFKTMFKEMFGAMQELEAEQPQASDDPPVQAGGDTGAPAEAVPGSADVEGNAALAAAQAEVARLREEQGRKIRTEAAAFADAQMTANRITPADRDRLYAAFVQAAEDDAERPMAGDASRLDFLRWSVEAREPHGLTTELLPQGQDAQALINTQKTGDPQGPQPISKERREELLSTTPLGRIALANGHENGRAS